MLAAGILFLFKGLFFVIASIARGIGAACSRSKVFAVVLVVVVLLGFGGAVDYAMNGSKIHKGVTVGSVDVAGMTVEEAESAISEYYQPRIDGGRVVIFADEETASSVNVEQQLVQDQALAEQVSFEEAQKNKKLWLEDAASLGVSLPAGDLASEAFSVGRGLAGLFDRIGAFFAGSDVPVRASYDEASLDLLASDIDNAIGDPRVDFNIVVNGGVASVVEGHDGMMIDRDVLKSQLDESFLLHETGSGTFVAHAEHAPLRIDRDAAQKTCDVVNDALSSGARFNHNGNLLEVSSSDLGSWVGTRIDELSGTYVLSPYIDVDVATPLLVKRVNEQVSGESVSVSIAVDGDQVSVAPHGELTVPVLDEALARLDRDLFESYRQGGEASDPSTVDVIDIATEQVSGAVSFEDAINYGIISEISTYTTQFVGTTSTQNRTHNIHLVADLLNNSVAAANGGKWSFNEVAGNCNEDAGFLPAGAIAGDDYIEEAGGGICQVATTVFNAVYEAGYTMVSRTNHSLCVASYPAGRDAAVSYPDLDFVWRNDTASDVLLKTSYTDSSITVTLYGVDPGYAVETETGEWVEGEKHSTKTKIDETLQPGTSYTKTAGTDGMEITVVRTVKDSTGAIVRQDSFKSIYSPVTELIVKGPDADDSGEDKADAATA